MGWLLDQGLKPTVIPDGSKIMSIKVKALNIKIIDSFNFLPMALSKLPGVFGFKELCKGHFPHMFNKRENQHYKGPLPDSSYYDCESMSESNRKAFFKWYNERKKTEFDCKKEMMMYCRYVY